MVEPLNPFLRAFAHSSIRGQCSPSEYVLLAPTYESLLNAWDRDSKSSYTDLVRTEEFIASHTIRVSVEQAPANAKENGSARDNRNKPRQCYTVNGRVIIIKDSNVYPAKGFKFANQAHIVGDELWHRAGQKEGPWPVIYIHRPLLGSYEARPILPATVPEPVSSPATNGEADTGSQGERRGAEISQSDGSSATSHPKRKIKSFVELLTSFPQIDRQLRPQLERVFKDMKDGVERPASPQSTSAKSAVLSRVATTSSDASSSSSRGRALSVRSMRSGVSESVPVLEITRDEEKLRGVVDDAVRSTIGAFQNIDKALLSHLTASTDVEGHALDGMIERFIIERVHSLYLFHKVCMARASDELQIDLRKIKDVDPIQVGVEVEDDRDARVDLSTRLTKGVQEIRKMSTASGPHAMLEILVDTLKIITTPSSAQTPEDSSSPQDSEASRSEKQHSAMSYNADTLVSLLLIVVIRSNVPYLKSRLSYMRYFIFFDDVDNGVNGYALSTFEVVLSYIDRESRPLMEASRRNRRLWKAIKDGNITKVRSMLGVETDESAVEDFDEETDEGSSTKQPLELPLAAAGDYVETEEAQTNGVVHPSIQEDISPLDSPLPALPWSDDSTSAAPAKKRRPRISFEAVSLRSMSDSNTDILSPLDQNNSGLHPALDEEHMARIRTTLGESLPKLAIDAQQREVLEIILLETDYWREPQHILHDCDDYYQTLLMAALRTGETPVIKCLMDRIVSPAADAEARKAYWTYQDDNSRAVGHYLYEYRPFILTLGDQIDWRQRDSAGRTPLVAICRSYDSLGYKPMVEDAIAAATAAQGDGKPLRLEDHVDDRGNSLLHILTNPHLVRKVLVECECDVNCVNGKQWTPLITAAKYGRLDVIRVLFADARLNPFFKDSSGLMAVEQAKSEPVRCLIDDLTLLRLTPAPDGRIAGVVRVVSDRTGSTSLLLKHTLAPPTSNSVTVCSCWRTLDDFRQLASCLNSEHPASWLPELSCKPLRFPSSVAGRAWVRAETTRWLNTILAHPAFAHHELVWEFFVLPEVTWSDFSERSRRKAEIRAETVRDDYEPVADPVEVEEVISASQHHVGEVERGLAGMCRRSRIVEQAASDVRTASHVLAAAVSTLTFLPAAHIAAVRQVALATAPPADGPQSVLTADADALTAAARALSTALRRVPALVGSMRDIVAAADKHRQAARRGDRLPGFLADTRARMRADAEARARREEARAVTLAKEVAASRDTVVPEMAAQEEWREHAVRAALRRFARGALAAERERLDRFESALRKARLG